MVRADMIVHVVRTMNVDPTIDTIIADFRATMSELKCASSERLLRLGMSMAQLNIMYTLHRHGEMTMSHLADVLNVSFSSATGLIDRMEERGFIERIRVPEDRRIVVVRLTAAGEALLEEVDALSGDLLRQVLVGLEPAQLDGMAQAIADLRAAVEIRHHDGPGPPSHLHASSTIAVDHARGRRSAGGPAKHWPRPRDQPITEGLTTHGSVPGRRRGVHPYPRRRPGPRPESAGEDGDPLRRHARPVPRRSGPDDRRSGAAHHRDPAVRQRLLRLGHHDLPADQHDQRPVLGQALGHLRPQADLHDRHRHLPDRLGAVRPESEHGDAHPLPRHPGHRRRVIVPGGTGGHR